MQIERKDGEFHYLSTMLPGTVEIASAAGCHRGNDKRQREERRSGSSKVWGWRSDSDDRMFRMEEAKTMAQIMRHNNRNNSRLVEQVAGIKTREVKSYLEGWEHSSGQVNGRR
jgi:hypothetical protein